MLIVLEGIDGAGKSTQAKILIQKLTEHGKKVGTFTFPAYNRFFGRIIKKFLRGELGRLSSQNPYLVSTLYAANRFECRETLFHLLKKNDIVVLQRYVTSSELYQTAHIPPAHRQKLVKWIQTMEYRFFGLPRPDIVIYLYLPVHLSYALIKKRGKTRELYEKQKLLAKVNAYAKVLARRENWFLIPCSKRGVVLSRQEIGRRVWEVVKFKVKN